MLKACILLLLCSTLAFASRRQQIRTLQTRVSEQEDTISKLRRENADLTADLEEYKQSAEEARRLREAKLTLESELEILQDDKEDSIRYYSRLTDSLQQMLMRSSGETSRPRESTETPRETFPITANLLSKRHHDDQNIAANIVFTNNSATHLERFTANVVFYDNSRRLHEVVIDVNQSVRAGENVSWFGAIPYDRNDSDQARFYNADHRDIDVKVEVRETVDSQGRERSYR
ncbi:hypothetical protein [Chitinivibrio alkaliphilus]|uniref:Uncharacterized protein n=1 Tax=Chitinivibrio alkaliphilus ACht1 TaxID=1313304 RepID=U7DEH1_9BACT|nr:hypothetical protein [Chitinivibrio alkaliphilus]ERP39321.1 hypothetical protein CALK_0117 [Chitinivibrio alkaliphilus ACht1]